jgi:hypothetical protein
MQAAGLQDQLAAAEAAKHCSINLEGRARLYRKLQAYVHAKQLCE